MHGTVEAMKKGCDLGGKQKRLLSLEVIFKQKSERQVVIAKIRRVEIGKRFSSLRK